MASSYSELDVDQVLATLEVLAHRIDERFPNAGLRGVCQELQIVGQTAKEEVERSREPIWPLRIGIFVLIGLMLAVLVIGIVNVRITDDTLHLTNLVDVVQNIIQDAVWLGLGIYFLIRLEAGVKRNRVFGTLHKLRSIAHVIDMHQLTKDPVRITGAIKDTSSSPKRQMTPFLLQRYLDYCSEMLAMTGKIAALYLGEFHDPVVVTAVTEIEELSAGLSRKIWQKISSIPEVTPEEA